MRAQRSAYVRVHIRDAAVSIDGLLLSRGRYFRLGAARFVESERTYAADGEVVIPRENVLAYQVIPPPEVGP